jgi:hypothetical protein
MNRSQLAMSRVSTSILIFSLIFNLLGVPDRSAFAAPVNAPQAAADCQNPPNEIVAENCLPGNPPSEWEISGAGDASIQGFATEISVDQGGTIEFKIDTTSTDYRIDIYRLGYYAGLGARKVATIDTPNTTETEQPDCQIIDGTTDDNLVDCGNWSVSASWDVPANAVSGIYIARPVRQDVGGDLASHIAFIVRDDDGASDLLFQTSDTTWQAYNQYGGYSLYAGPSGHAHKVSYNRPFTTRDTPIEDWLFNAEYPMLRWLERNGYDVSYFTDVDSDRNGDEILEHDVFLSVGHDEYWSAGQRTAVEAARDNGVHLAFFSGNEIYWKTRWADNFRTLVSYKEGDAQGSEHYNCEGNFDCDPDPSVWTGLWRQNQTGHDGGQPENALSGQISWGDATTAIQVPAAATALRFWRNTGMSGNTTLTANTLGYEFDWEQPAFASSYPAGRITLSDTTAVGKNHKMSLYRAPSGALVFGAGTVQWSWGLDETHDRAASTEDPRMQQATVNLFSDMGVQPGSLQDGLVPGGALDETAPTTTITDPAPGATVPGGNVTVSGTAADTGGIVAAVEVSTDGGTTWGRATGTANWTYTFSASDGPITVQARAIDDAVNTGAATSVSFEAGPQECPCTIWTPQVGGGTTFTDGPVELGLKFRADVDGYITGIRFWKPAGAGGTHVGHLWNVSGGPALGEVTFAGETASGWQEATFAAPIEITANTTYIASYHAPSGYSSSNGYFAGSGVDSPPLHALANGVDGPNGVYKYGGSGTFPDETFQSSNYWVDVIFVTEVGPDTTPPIVNSVSPVEDASGVATSTNVSAVFNEPLDANTVSGATFELRNVTNQLVPATVTYNNAARTATLDPDAALANSSTYTARLVGGTSGIKDAAGNALAADFEWSFTTSSPPPPPPNDGPGGPILIISAASNPFTRYYTEILRAEGLNEFLAVDLSSVNATLLADYQVAILGEVSLSAAQVTLLSDWVNSGGNLIAMRPDPQLASLLGLTPAGATLSEGYLQVDTGAAPGAGLTGQTIQFHGTADRYTLNGATGVATLYSSASTATSNPAVTLVSVGSNGGQAAAFTYDLAKSVVYTRQGNPAWINTNGDGSSGPVRADDLFHNGTDPDWVNLNKVAIPQADEQQRLLANLILHMNLDRTPLPRFWYFPRDEKAVVLMTGDDHASSNVPGRLDHFISLSPQGCSVADWECVRASAYIYDGSTLTEAQANSYTADGFEIGVHVQAVCGDSQTYTLGDLQSVYTSQLASFATRFPSLPQQDSERTHCIAWSGWAYQAEVKEQKGIRLDTNYYYWPSAWVGDRPGFMTGSGIPMRFADVDGSIFDVYQAATQMTDESGQSYPATINALINNALDAQGYYGVFTANMHSDSLGSSGADAIVAAALANGVPVVSGRQLLTWLDGRNNSSFEALDYQGGVLSFQIDPGAGANGLRAMLPVQGAGGALTGITRNSSAVSYTTQTIKGVQYALFDAVAGNYEASYLADETAPVISAVTATNNTDGTTTITWTTDEASDSRVDYGTVSGALNLNASDPAAVTSHSITLTGLTPGTTYYYTVTSKDASNNSAASTESNFVAAGVDCPCSIWEDTFTGVNGNDPSSNELGVKFRSSQDGFITALRFYKFAENTGTHVGRLWDMAGNLLGSATFTDETASGWQEATLDQPVAITANTIYVASYSTETGFYAFSGGYFATQGVDNGPLHALSAPESPEPGTNGVFNATPGAFPDTSFNAANYWVDVVFDTELPADTTPPVIGNVTATPAGDGTAEITWTTDEASDSLVEYGTTSGALNLSESDAADVTLHSITLTGLAPNTTYYYQVTSQDAADNSATSAEASFTTPAQALVDTSAADFNASEANACYVSEMGNGELILPPAIGVEFGGAALPAGWGSSPWTGGTSTVSGGQLSVDGARAAPDTFYAAGRSLEFVATFGTATFQNIGFGETLEATAEYWALFGTANSTDTLYARTNLNNSVSDTPIPGNWLGTPHRYRIEWGASQVLFYIDGNLVHTANLTIPQTMRPVISDFQAGGPNVSVDWLHMSEYASPCEFTSRVLDAGAAADWDELTATATTPSGTALGFETQSSTDNVNWSGWEAVGSAGEIASPNGRYIQYRATLSSSDTSQTPVIESVALTYAAVTNTAPAAVDDSYATAEDTDLDVAAPGVLENDTDAEDDPLTAIKLTDPANGTLTFNSDGSFLYQPNPGFNGADSFTYKANDGAADSGPATVSITVGAENDPPVAVDDPGYVVLEDGSLSTLVEAGVLANDTDPDGDTLTAIKVTDPAHGALTFNQDGTFTYTPAADYNGPDSFTYQANDGAADSNVATASITVTPVNDAPVAVDDAAQAHDGIAAVIPVLANDSDVDQDTLTITEVGVPGNGAATISDGGTTVTYTADAGFNGEDSFTYTISDGQGGTANATVTVQVSSLAIYVRPGGDDAQCDGTANVDYSAGVAPACAVQTIQRGIDLAPEGRTVNIAAGTYVENLVVNKSLEIAGAGQASTIVIPAITGANPCSGASLCPGASNLILVEANDVVIHDLTVDGDNPALTGSSNVGGANLDARNGIITNHAAGVFNGLEVFNTTVKNIYLRGMYASSSGTFNFHDNTVTNVQAEGASIAMFAWGGPGAMANNTVSFANDAISANHSKGIQFLDNTVTNSLSGIHTDNAGDGGGVADLIQGNTVDCTDTPGAYGVWTFVPYIAPTVNDNTVTNCDVSLSAWGQGAAVTHQFTNNNVSNTLAAGSVGAYITTDLISFGYTDISVNFTGNVITGFETGLYFTADQQSWNPQPYEAKTITAAFHLNQISGNTVPADKGASGTYVIDLENNWWGSASGPTGVTDMDYTPWCGDAGCTHSTPVQAAAPLGEQTSWNGTFSWVGVRGATNYLLEVYDASDTRIYRAWQTPISAGCVGGGTCTKVVAALGALADGEYTWRIQDYGTSYGYGQWTDFTNFNINITAPTPDVVLLTPDGEQTSWNGTFSWTGVSAATNYLLEVYDASDTRIYRAWQTPASADCVGGGTCTKTISALSTLANGSYTWRIQDYGSSYGYGIWTEKLDFNINITPPASGVELLSPVDEQTSWNGTFSWTAVSDATNYLIEVYDASNTRIYRAWHSPASAGCTGGGTCTKTISALGALANGSYTWRIRDYGTSYGYGPWTDYADFTIAVP